MSTDGSTSQEVVFQIPPVGSPASLFPDIEAKGAAFTQKMDPETGAPAVETVRGVNSATSRNSSGATVIIIART